MSYKKTFQKLVSLAGALLLSACALTATRPMQEMADTSYAIKAAREVQADSLAPELYRQASEWFFKARQEYKVKNFELARNYAIRARRFAERAEFESIRNGGNRTDLNPPDPMANQPPPPPEPLPEPLGIPAESYQEPAPPPSS